MRIISCMLGLIAVVAIGSSYAEPVVRDSVVRRAAAVAKSDTTRLATSSKASVGVIEYARGAATLQGSADAPQLVGRGTRFDRNDVITTGRKSFAILRLSDGTRLTLRPNSKFAVEQFNPSRDEKAGATLRLFKGGMRTVTGFISKYNRNGYKMRTSVATIGIRGTEFDARLCDEACEQERKKLTPVDVAKPIAIGRVAFMRGKLAARNEDGRERIVRRGEPVYEGDTLVSGHKSFGVIAFRDKSRITLKPRSQFHIEKFSFNEAKPKDNVALMSLLRGGLRAVTGRIGKLNRNNYSMRTPVATIGIRGTGYDLQCQGSCVSLEGAMYQLDEPSLVDRFLALVSQPAYADGLGDGMYASVWDGAIDIQQQGGTQQLNIGQHAFIPNTDIPIRLLDASQLPLAMQQGLAPRPDQVDIDEEALFEELDQAEAQPGLYVSVYDGVVTMLGEGGEADVDIAAGEAAFSSGDGELIKRLTEQPWFQLLDWIPNPADFPDVDALDIQGQDDTVCTII